LRNTPSLVGPATWRWGCVPYSYTTANSTGKKKTATQMLLDSDNEEENRRTYRWHLGTPLTDHAVLVRLRRAPVPQMQGSDDEREAKDPTERRCCVILAYQALLIALNSASEMGESAKTSKKYERDATYVLLPCCHAMH
jgi:hypothetical protein